MIVVMLPRCVPLIDCVGFPACDFQVVALQVSLTPLFRIASTLWRITCLLFGVIGSNTVVLAMMLRCLPLIALVSLPAIDSS